MSQKNEIIFQSERSDKKLTRSKRSTGNSSGSKKNVKVKPTGVSLDVSNGSFDNGQVQVSGSLPNTATGPSKDNAKVKPTGVSLDVSNGSFDNGQVQVSGSLPNTATGPSKDNAKVEISSIDDVVPDIFLRGGILRVKDIIDRKIGDCIGIKRIGSLGVRVFPEKIPTHVYIWFTHFFELSRLMADMIKAETLNPGSTKKWIKFVNCILERDMYQRQPVHDNKYLKDCFQCRRYFEKLEDISVWWFDIGNEKFIRMTFKMSEFSSEDTKFECCVFWIKVSGLLELQLKVEDASVGSSIRRNFSVATISSVENQVCGVNPLIEMSSQQLQQSVQKEDSSFDSSMPRTNISRGSVPDYESSPERTESQTKRPKIEKNWTKIRDFANSKDAEEFIQKENCWAKNTTKETNCGEKVYYRCNRAKLRGKQCESGTYLFYDSKTPTVTLFKSSNDHSCATDGNSSKTIPISEEVKQFIRNAFNDGLRGRKQIQCKLAEAKLPIPTKNQLNNFLTKLRQESFGSSKISLNELELFFVKNSKVPDDPDEPYVVNHHVNYEGEGNFLCFISTRNLLKNAVNREVVCADATYKMTWEGFPLSPIGTTDMDRRFHLYGTLLSKDEKTADFEFAFRSLKGAVQKIHNYDMKPTVLISDMSGAIHNAAKAVFGIDIFIRACWFHMKKALKLKLAQLIKDKKTQNSILSDVDTLQLSQNPDVFNRASKLFIQKYQKHEEFVKYFSDVWLEQNRNWYEGCTPIPSPSTNNALESWNSLIKKEKSYRNRFPLNQFLGLFFQWHSQWSQEYSSGTKKVVEIPTVDLELYTKAYNWARLNKPLKSSIDSNGLKSYSISAGADSKVVDFQLIDNWTTFDQFKTRAFIGWKIIWEDNWQNSICNCPVFMKQYICKHVVGIAFRKNLIDVPMEAKTVPIGKKRKRGRPSKARKALLVQ